MLGAFLLTVLSFPFIEKGIHDLAHANDDHCEAKGVFHIHELQHQCSICDFDGSSPIAQPDPNFGLSTLSTSDFVFYFHAQDHFPAAVAVLSLRGPPSA